MEAEQFDVHAQRVVSASAGAVFAAWTTPELVRRWWGPAGFTCPVADLDVREGGVSLVVMRAPAGTDLPDIHNTWSYTRVQPDRRLEYLSRFVAADRTALTPSEAGLPGDGVPDTVPHVVTFESLTDATSRVTVRESGYTTRFARDLSAEGMRQCLDKLATLFAPATPGPSGTPEDAL